MNSKHLPLILIACLLLALAGQVGSFMVQSSNTYDEAAIIGAGISYIKTARLDLEHTVHPPFQKYLVGLFVNSLAPSFDFDSDDLKNDRPYPFGHTFVFHNTVRPERILAMGRLPTLLLSLLLAACVVLWSNRWFGVWGAVGSLAAYAFEPNILAHSGLATMDIGQSCFMFLASFLLVIYLEENKPLFLLLSGVAAGLASMTKISGVFIFAWLMLLLAMDWKGRAVRPRDAVFLLSRSLVLSLVAGGVMLIVYQFSHVRMLVELIQRIFRIVFQKDTIQNYFNFLHGQLKIGGWPHYYLVAFSVKTTVPFLLLSLLSFFLVPRDKVKVISILIFSYVLICTFSDKQNGLRYLLPVFPFLCVLIGGLITSTKKHRWIGVFTGVCLAWHAAEAISIFPNYLTYFNEFAGGPRNGYKWLVDCNLDWGQDFPAIRRFLVSEGYPDIIVATLGNADRDYYLGSHQDLIADTNSLDRLFNHINRLDTKRELLIVSASLYQGFGLSDPSGFSWLRDKTPYAQIANSTFVWDVTNDWESQYRIGEIYHRNHLDALADRQLKRANQLKARQASLPNTKLPKNR